MTDVHPRHIDPPVRLLFEAMAGAAPAAPPADLDERRAAANATMLLIHPGPEPDVVVTDHEVAVSGGQIRVRVHRPASATGPGPTLFFIHGGGWFQGNLDTAEVECGPMASAVPCTVVSVDYRLAPEHPFPVPLEDCLAAYSWMHAHAGEARRGPGPARHRRHERGCQPRARRCASPPATAACPSPWPSCSRCRPST